jgi:hypothetical protein
MLGRLLAIAALLLALVAGNPIGAQEEASNSSQRPAPPALPEDQASPGTVPPPPRIVPRDPRVLFITAANSEPSFTELIRLRSPGGAFPAMISRGWKIGPGPENHVQVVDSAAIPEIVRSLNVREFPTVACISEGQILRSFKSGCTTPLDAWTFGWLLTGKNERPPASVPEPARVASTGSYRLRGNHWSVDGDWNPARATVVSHLRSPSHGYRIASNWRLESWSYEELRSLHDDLHDQEQAYAPAAKPAPATRWPKDYSNGIRK